ncbi:hypothetical protein GON03_11690 [Nocardioides sp. MAH-18]|uniref:Uncharacterized protein n=1 Tax=Nocardioides agri TaxID=2682843 RepID=A0A6L6XT82_9ACTN|nr:MULTISPECIES: arylsulfotransferase family protein [unclassified Nocardioides]MBA2954993.1 aryl-sulfate sulfotransferase [Nocardioides sp. CGMCC 1.13656]MVQ49847.1 hypothetical protein [Nocardioides sp. MAH-18]
MVRGISVVVSLALILAGAVLGVARTADADPPGLDITVDGTGVATYPAFDPAIHRYGVTTTAATAGTVTVSVAAGPDAAVRIDGRPAPTSSRTFTGLTSGDEISVLVTSAGATTPYSFVYLPAGFPKLERVPAGTDSPSPGYVFLTLALWVSPSPTYEAAVDANGVPVYVRSTDTAIDLKPIPGGYSVGRSTTVPNGGSDLVELDSAFREVRRRHTSAPVVNTDGHDSVLMPDGSAYLLSYEPNVDTGDVDTIIQQVSADGTALFTWNSKDHVDIEAETVTDRSPANPNRADYAHSNSIQVLPDGDLLVSFRHLSSAFKIARTAHDGYAVGDVIWKLGGRDSDFAFTDEEGDPDGGPCAQHTVYQVAPGRILMFDNGSGPGGFAPPMCINPADPTGPTIARPHTRIVEWAYSWDETTHTGTAHVVRSYAPAGRFALFAGSSQRLPNGHTMIGWAASTPTMATELDEDGDPVWELRDPSATPYFTYRAFKGAAPDTQRPDVAIASPAPGAVYQLGAPSDPVVADCTDRGGSSLATCEVPVLSTAVAGTHSYEVTAADRAGNTTTVKRSYTVVASPTTPAPTAPTAPATTPGRPDARVRVAGGRPTGDNRYDWTGKHRRTVRLAGPVTRRTAWVTVVNRGEEPARFALSRTADSRRFRAVLTSADGVRRSTVLAPGEAWTIRVRVERSPRARPGDERVFLIRVRSATDPLLRDAVAVHVRAVR